MRVLCVLERWILVSHLAVGCACVCVQALAALCARTACSLRSVLFVCSCCSICTFHAAMHCNGLHGDACPKRQCSLTCADEECRRKTGVGKNCCWGAPQEPLCEGVPYVCTTPVVSCMYHLQRLQYELCLFRERAIQLMPPELHAHADTNIPENRCVPALRAVHVRVCLFFSMMLLYWLLAHTTLLSWLTQYDVVLCCFIQKHDHDEVWRERAKRWVRVVLIV